MIRLKKDVPLKKHTTLKIGGKSKYFLTVHSTSEIKEALEFIRKNNCRYFIIGYGSNILANEEGFDGVVIRTTGLKGILLNGKRIICGAGERVNDLVLFCAEHGLSGFENLYGIPGTIGGAAVNNAGAFGDDICPLVDEVKLINTDGDIEAIDRSEISYGYRESNLKGRGVIFEMTFSLKKGDTKEIFNVIEQIKQKRKDAQPYEFSSAGSIFKNPALDPAGKLIEMAGLKGFRIGGAQISEKHGNFIINRGNAAYKDIKDLIDLIKGKIKEKFGIDLELEIEVLSNN